MRKIKSLLFPVFALLLSTSVFASTIPYKNTVSEDMLRKEIVQKFKSVDISSMNLKDNSVRVQFIINDNNELIVLKTDNKEIDALVKIVLNYKEVKVRDLSRNSLYAISLKLVS